MGRGCYIFFHSMIFIVQAALCTNVNEKKLLGNVARAKYCVSCMAYI